MTNELESLLKLRTAQIVASTEEEKEEDGHPIGDAESCPNRFNVISLFFSDNDGVTITQDLDYDGEPQGLTVEYFAGDDKVEVTEGDFYDWAVNYFEERF